MRPLRVLGVVCGLGACAAAPSKPAADTDTVDTDGAGADTDGAGADTDAPDTDGAGADTDDSPIARCLAQPGRNATNGLDPDELCPGELVITELLADPRDCSANRALGQYLEVYNASGLVVHLASSGLLLDVGTQVHHLVTPIGDGDADVEPGAYFTVHPLQYAAYCHDFARRFTLDSTQVLLSHDSIALTGGGFEVDRVDFTAFASTSGASLQLRPVSTPPDAAANNTPDQWCDATTLLLPAGSTDRGTPHAANVCAP